MHSLSTLPRELLVDILLHCEPSASVLALWASGDHGIRHKLESAVESIDLGRTAKQWPQCLSRFQRLRRLSIEEVSFSNPAHLQHCLFSLSLDLEELTVIATAYSHPYPSYDAIPAGATNFSRLRKLCLSKLQWRESPFFLFITRNVTDFSIPYAIPPFGDYLPLYFGALGDVPLPPKIETLDGIQLYADFNIQAFPSLRHVRRIFYSATSVLDLRSLSPLELLAPHLTWSSQIASLCPSSVTSLRFHLYEYTYPAWDWVSSMPRALTSLDCAATIRQSDAVNLPRSLKHLTLRTTTYGWSKSSPSGLPDLRSLYLEYENGDDFLELLPPSLTSLWVNSMRPRRELHCGLPLSITELHLTHPVSFLELPPNLQKLTIPRMPKSKDAAIPPTLTHLSCQASLVRRDLKLIHSHHLTSLEIDHCSEDLFAFLPRSLTCLKIAKLVVKAITVRQQINKWGQLPTGLESLTIHTHSYTSVDLQALEKLPLLRTFYLSTGLWGDFPTWLHHNLLHIRYMCFHGSIDPVTPLPAWLCMTIDYTSAHRPWYEVRRY